MKVYEDGTTDPFKSMSVLTMHLDKVARRVGKKGHRRL